jgi:hypothetical protein
LGRSQDFARPRYRQPVHDASYAGHAPSERLRQLLKVVGRHAAFEDDRVVPHLAIDAAKVSVSRVGQRSSHGLSQRAAAPPGIHALRIATHESTSVLNRELQEVAERPYDIASLRTITVDYPS